MWRYSLDGYGLYKWLPCSFVCSRPSDPLCSKHDVQKHWCQRHLSILLLVSVQFYTKNFTQKLIMCCMDTSTVSSEKHLILYVQGWVGCIGFLIMILKFKEKTQGFAFISHLYFPLSSRCVYKWKYWEWNEYGGVYCSTTVGH